MNNKRKLLSILAVVTMLCLLLTACSGKTNEGGPIYEVADDEYSIVIVSDTQFLSQDNPDAFYSLTEFCEANVDALNIEYLVHTGDIVQAPYAEDQWAVADEAFKKLTSLPHGVLPGNHDTGNGDNKYDVYCKYFGESRFSGKEWYGESHENNRAHYDLITMGGTDFVVVYLSDDPSNCCIQFANDVFAKYPERVGIFCTHNYLENDGRRSDMGDYFYSKIIAQNSNVSMVLCGHNDVTVCTTEKVDENRTVYQLMTNYQDGDIRTDGYVLFLKVSPADGKIYAITYSPYKNDFTGHSDESTDEFEIPIPWK